MTARTGLAFAVGLGVLASVPGCATDPGPDPDDFSLTEVSTSGPVHLTGLVEVLESHPIQYDPVLYLENPGPDLVAVGYGACAWGVRVYRGTEPSGPVVWHNLPPKDAVCPLWYRQLEIEPGGAERIALGRLVTPDLRAVLSPGEYFLGGVINLNGVVTEIPLGSLVLP